MGAQKAVGGLENQAQQILQDACCFAFFTPGSKSRIVRLAGPGSELGFGHVTGLSQSDLQKVSSDPGVKAENRKQLCLKRMASRIPLGSFFWGS